MKTEQQKNQQFEIQHISEDMMWDLARLRDILKVLEYTPDALEDSVAWDTINKLQIGLKKRARRIFEINEAEKIKVS